MRFLIDENVRKDVVDFLRAAGHDVLMATAGSQDGEIAQTAQESKRVILTHDQHFADILMYPPRKYSGIIRIKIHPPIAPIIINALSDLMHKMTPEQIDKRLIILGKDGLRIR